MVYGHANEFLLEHNLRVSIDSAMERLIACLGGAALDGSWKNKESGELGGICPYSYLGSELLG